MTWDKLEDKQIMEFYPGMELFGFKIVLKREICEDDDSTQTTIDYIMAKDNLHFLFDRIIPLSKDANEKIKILKEAKKKIDSITKESMDSLLEQAKKILEESK